MIYTYYIYIWYIGIGTNNNVYLIKLHSNYNCVLYFQIRVGMVNVLY